MARTNEKSEEYTRRTGSIFAIGGLSALAFFGLYSLFGTGLVTDGEYAHNKRRIERIVSSHVPTDVGHLSTPEWKLYVCDLLGKPIDEQTVKSDYDPPCGQFTDADVRAIENQYTVR